MKVKSENEVAQLCPTLSDPMDCSLPVSSIHGIFQARVLEWGAIAFSGAIREAHNKKKIPFMEHYVPGTGLSALLIMWHDIFIKIPEAKIFIPLFI